MKLSDKLLKKHFEQTPYQRVAKEFGVTAKFVGMIARGERKPVRGKGLLIKKRLEYIIQQQEEKTNHLTPV